MAGLGERNQKSEASAVPSGIGLGCSRFGSIVNGADEKTVDRLIDAAFECGVTHFDTADIYGQGDSERLLARSLRRHQRHAFVATKVGQRFPLMQRLLRPLKAPLVSLVASVGAARSQLQKARAQALPRCYQPEYVRSAVASSLRRLNRDHVNLVYLHSPVATDLADGTAVEVLDAMRSEGLVDLVGVSCDELDTARQALLDARVSVLQVPYLPHDALWQPLLAEAQHQKVAVVVRSVFGGSSSNPDASDRKGLIVAAATNIAIRSILVGTSNEQHLRQVTSWT